MYIDKIFDLVNPKNMVFIEQSEAVFRFTPPKISSPLRVAQSDLAQPLQSALAQPLQSALAQPLSPPSGG
jgi:hypothetical protein